MEVASGEEGISFSVGLGCSGGGLVVVRGNERWRWYVCYLVVVWWRGEEKVEVEREVNGGDGRMRTGNVGR